jgi:hypothetical protein
MPYRAILSLLIILASALVAAHHYDVTVTALGTTTFEGGSQQNYTYANGSNTASFGNPLYNGYFGETLNCSGQVTFTFNWNEDGTGQSPPSWVVVKETSNAGFVDYNPNDESLPSYVTLADGFGDSTVTDGWDPDQGDDEFSSYRNNFIVVNSPGQ